jgi:hypothetical protein
MKLKIPVNGGLAETSKLGRMGFEPAQIPSFIDESVD